MSILYEVVSNSKTMCVYEFMWTLAWKTKPSNQIRLSDDHIKSITYQTVLIHTQMERSIERQRKEKLYTFILLN